MRCPHCDSQVASPQGICQNCGNLYRLRVSGNLPLQSTSQSGILAFRETSTWTLMRGDVLGNGRYRLVEEVILPKNQQGQTRAWLALDLREAMRRQVLLYRLEPGYSPPGKTQQLMDLLAVRLAPLSTHPGLPAVTDVFQEKETLFIVQQHPIGESLAVLMQRLGGALPERDVAEYGRQLCEILAIMATQQPPLIHAAISAETIVVSPDKNRAFLIYMPLLPPLKLPRTNGSKMSYAAPELIRDGDVRPSSDLYSLAATMHHAVTGFDPHERMATFYPPARRLNPLVSPAMEVILSRQLRYSISQRYARAEDMKKDLDALIASYPPIDSAPLPQSPTATSLRLSGEQKVAHSKQTRRRNISIAVGSVLVVLALFAILGPLVFGPLAVRHHTSVEQANATATAAAQGALDQNALLKQEALELQSFKQKGIGLSDGRLVFDTYAGRTDVSLKQQAASALQQGNMSEAVNLLNQAISADPTDGEAQIYNENIHILQDNAPYVTLAIGLPIVNNAFYLGSVREQLEAAYLAQHETNSEGLLPHGLKLRIIIANSGANNADVATVAQFIANRVSKAGNLDHLFGVVGWYNSTQTVNARDILASVHLPLIAPTASSVKLSGSSPYFFRICPPDNFQGQVLGTLLISNLKAKKVLILVDPTDTYSVSLANAVASRVQSLGGSFAQQTFTENQTTVAQYERIVATNVFSATPANGIFLAGFNVDAVRLAHAVGELSRANPQDLPLGQLKIVGGDAVDSGLLLGEGNSADAAIARAFPQDMRRLTFTTFADFNEWNFLKIAQKQQPPFFDDWHSTYQENMVGNNAPDPQYKGLMTYDTVGVYVHVASLIHGPVTGDAVRKALLTLGTAQIPSYQGVSGRIMFDNQGNPVNKAVVILTVQQAANGNNAIVIQQVVGKFR
jgi:ABC-type branched-subunit amino acid transport system substrate-binding protein/type II secretory pathway pseudopilin PulG